MALVRLPIIMRFVSIASATICYDYSGAESAALPYNATAPISSYCDPQDVCLFNGLCLSVSENNLLTVQGYTSLSWPSPYQNYCKGKASSRLQAFTLRR